MREGGKFSDVLPFIVVVVGQHLAVKMHFRFGAKRRKDRGWKSKKNYNCTAKRKKE